MIQKKNLKTKIKKKKKTTRARRNKPNQPKTFKNQNQPKKRIEPKTLKTKKTDQKQPPPAPPPKPAQAPPTTRLFCRSLRSSQAAMISLDLRAPFKKPNQRNEKKKTQKSIKKAMVFTRTPQGAMVLAWFLPGFCLVFAWFFVTQTKRNDQDPQFGMPFGASESIRTGSLGIKPYENFISPKVVFDFSCFWMAIWEGFLDGLVDRF